MGPLSGQGGKAKLFKERSSIEVEGFGDIGLHCRLRQRARDTIPSYYSSAVKIKELLAMQ